MNYKRLNLYDNKNEEEKINIIPDILPEFPPWAKDLFDLIKKDETNEEDDDDTGGLGIIIKKRPSDWHSDITIWRM